MVELETARRELVILLPSYSLSRASLMPITDLAGEEE